MAGASRAARMISLRKGLLLVKQPDNVQLQLELAYQPEA